jgi:hypothetical protein
MAHVTVDEIKRELVQAFEPMRCEFKDRDFERDFEFWVFDEENRPAFHLAGLRIAEYQEPKERLDLIERARQSIARWRPPRAATA